MGAHPPKTTRSFSSQSTAMHSITTLSTHCRGADGDRPDDVVVDPDWENESEVNDIYIYI